MVVDADSHQLAAIEAVKRGKSLVLHGPPGTGKSQTITNVIAESVAAGKTVLFVSEKMAALEVVYKRIREAHLGHFCLELHSHRANKREVVQELYRCLEERLEPKQMLSAQEMETLVRRRQQLCDYVHALHVVRRPMERSVHDVLAELAGLNQVPFLSFEYADVANLSPSLAVRIGELTNRLQTVWGVVLEGEAFPWKGCTERTYTAAIRATYQQVVGACLDSVRTLADAARLAADAVGVAPCPLTLADCHWLGETLKLLAESPKPHRAWLLASDLDPLVSEARDLQTLTRTYHELRRQIEDRHGPAFLDLPSVLSEQIRAARDDTAALLHGEATDERILVTHVRAIARWADDLSNRASDWDANGTKLLALLGLPAQVLTTKRLTELVRVVALCASDARPVESWLEARRCREVSDEVPRLRESYGAFRACRHSLLERYSQRVLDLDLDRLVPEFSGRYSSLFRYVMPSYYRDRRAVGRCSLDGRVLSTVRDDLVLAWDLKRRRDDLDARAQHDHDLLGAYYEVYDTDFDRVDQALTVAAEALGLAGCSPLPPALSTQLALDGVASAEARDVAGRLRSSLAESQSLASAIGTILSLSRLPTSSLPPSQTALPQLREWGQALADAAGRLADGFETAERASASGIPETIHNLLSDLAVVRQVHGLDSQIAAEGDRLRTAYGERFRGMDTSWENVLLGLDWADRARRHFAGHKITAALIDVAAAKPSATPDPDQSGQLLQQAETALGSLEARFDEPPIVDGIRLRDHPFPNLLGRLSEIAERVDDIRDWVDLQTIRKDFGDIGLGDLAVRLEVQMPSAESVPRMVRLAVLQKWVEYIFEHEPCLGRFRGQDHENLIAEFQDLDRRHWQVGAHRVIAEANKHKPRVEYVPRDSEVRVLRTEALKQRRHLPIRRLFERMPDLITRLKPCLLMSPLSASQFLNPDMRFDLVVFDEASQICTEEAVCAVYRGSQLLVCGDNKQLPPTAFFRTGMSDEFEGDEPEEDEGFEPLDSVLDDCLALGMRQGWLRWHYRSRHESLIAFSNSRFYDSRLVTFPSCFREHEDLGIKFKYVPDAVYGRGRGVKHDNPREAEVVADFVFDHFLRHQTSKSLGVVAFSQDQMETIEDELERRLQLQPEMQRYFSTDRMEGFFVKNLENVQGDQRDVMVFSIGYGRDRTGRMTMGFGPLNQAGGERRLNVAVTRAREKVILVSSIRAADIDLANTQAPGVLALHRYLDYAERGINALELAELAQAGESESPLERDVAQAIVQMGYDVVPQVGCSGFRVDLGVLDPAQPGRFLLGVECDGASYHSSYVARDKDRLRQEVLQRLGWRIHRVWSPDWVGRRDTETRRLRAAIEDARKVVGAAPDTGNNPGNPHSQTNSTPPPTTRTITITDDDDHPSGLSWTTPYRVDLLYVTGKPQGSDFHLPERRPEQVRLVEKVVTAEGPIHVDLVARRLAQAWGLQRVGSRVDAAATEAIRRASRGGKVKQNGHFLWPADPQFRLRVRVPSPGDPETQRKVEHIAPEEIGLAMRHIVKAGIGISRDALVIETARVFGFERTGYQIRDQLEGVVQKLVTRGEIEQRGDVLRMPNGRN